MTTDIFFILLVENSLSDTLWMVFISIVSGSMFLLLGLSTLRGNKKSTKVGKLVTATITQINHGEDAQAFVSYRVDNMNYRNVVLDSYVITMKEGSNVRILVTSEAPDEPKLYTRFNILWFPIFIALVGVGLFLFAIYLVISLI